MASEYVTCIQTAGYQVSLVLNATYKTVRDHVAENHKMIRIIDESGEDYPYPTSYFLPVGVPATVAGQDIRINH